MKKELILTVMGALCATGASAQAVLGYSLKESAGSYVPLDNPTVIFDGTDTEVAKTNFARNVITPAGIESSAVTTEGFSLGFDLNFAGATYSDFLVSAGGYVILGNGEISFNPFAGANFLTYAGDYTAAGFSDNSGVGFNADTKISYQIKGSGDDSSLVVEFKNYGLNYSFWSDPAYVDLQVILTKSGDMEIVLNNLSNLTEEGAAFPIIMGLRNGSDYVCATGTSGQLVLNRNSESSGNAKFDAAVADGATVSFNVPGDCIKPATQPSGLMLTASSTGVEGEFTATADADTYLVVYTIGDAAAPIPADGTAYAAGDALGDGVVAYFGSKTDFTLGKLEGGRPYHFFVYAANSYGLNGPVYNTESPLNAAIATLPQAAAQVGISAPTLNSVTLDVVSNDVDDDVVIVYNTYCERTNIGDHGLFGSLPADAKAGDVIPVPEDFTPYWKYEDAMAPENAGVVAYVGKAGKITVSDLKPGTEYYMAVYTRDAEGRYTSDPLYTGSSTVIEVPFEGDSYNYPRYQLPFGWESSVTEGNVFEFRDEDFFDSKTGAARQGTQFIQQRAQMNRGDAANGKEAWMTLPPVDVNARHCVANFNYCIVEGVNRFTTQAYNSWAEGDMLEIRLSEDDGATWTPVATYTAEDHAQQAETLSYVDISADLNEYRGKTVMLRLYWKTFANPAFGLNMYVDRVSVLQAEFPAVPEVSVGKISHESAVVSWTSQQTDYQIEYAEKGAADSTTVDVDGAMTYTVTGLDAETEYTVRVRGRLEGDGEAFTEWSDPVDFTTIGYPAVEAPGNLVSEVSSEAGSGAVKLSWDESVDAESYEVAYRMSTSTQWIYKNCEGNSLVLDELEAGKEYIWKVRAFCSHDRETPYSAQARFTAPDPSGVKTIGNEAVSVMAGDGRIEIAGAAGSDISICDMLGNRVAFIANASGSETVSLEKGFYIVIFKDSSCKVNVR